jgi:hypothetical protein
MFLPPPDLGWTSVPTPDGLLFDQRSATLVIRGKGWDSFMVLLQTKGIAKSFGATPVLRYVDLCTKYGELIRLNPSDVSSSIHL